MRIDDVFIYLRSRDAAASVRFYEAAFGARETFRLTEPSGRIGHVELALGPSTLMISDEFPEMGIRAPDPGTEAPVTVHLHVDDADGLIDRAVKAGATLVRPAADHFYGERSGTVRDPFGYAWMIGHRIEEVTPEEMQRRYTALFEGGA